MDRGLISTRYARSLLDFAIEEGQHKEVYNNMKTLSDVFWEVPKLREALTNSSIQQEDRKKLLFTASGGEIPSSLQKMADLIFLNEREDLIQYISLRFIELYRERFKIVQVRLVTAIPLNLDENRDFKSRVQKIVGENIELEPIVNPDIIGGFILHLDDYRWDASISGELTRVKSQFKKIEAVNALKNK